MRVRDRSTTDALAVPPPGPRGSSRAAPPPVPFGEHLQAAQASAVRHDLDRLYLDVEEEGRCFLADPTPETLARYKAQVRQFIAFVVRNGLKLRSSLTARELHQIVERVDEELLALADALLARERPLLDIASRVDQINGILLDLKA
jgi:uncharacterized protein YaaR (DUF327 family)